MVDYIDSQMNEDAHRDEDVGEAIPVHIIRDDRKPERTLSPAESKEEGKCIDLLKRTRAEFINYKRRIEQERVNLAYEGCRNLINSLLPVLDDLDHFFAHHAGINDEVVDGVSLVNEKLFSILKSAGLQEFGKKGDRFDPEIHEAVLVEDSDLTEDGTILEVWQPGYYFHDRLLRAAKVKVAKKSTRAGDE